MVQYTQIHHANASEHTYIVTCALRVSRVRSRKLIATVTEFKFFIFMGEIDRNQHLSPLLPATLLVYVYVYSI